MNGAPTAADAVLPAQPAGAAQAAAADGPGLLPASAVPRIGPGFRLQWEAAQDCMVLLYPEGMVKLNQSAGEILRRCDGQRSIEAVTAELEAAFQTQALQAEVLGFVQMALQRRWLVLV